MRKISTGLLAVLAVVATVVLSGGPASAASDPWIIQPYTSKLCLQPTNNSSASGVIVEQTYCTTGVDRNWDFHKIDANYYRISYRNGDKCFGVKSSSTANSAKIITQACGNPTLNDQWRPVLNFTAGDLDYYLLKNRHSGKCLNVQGNSTAAGADMIQYTCSSTANNEAFTWFNL